VPLDIYKLTEQFDAGDFDIVMAGLVMTEERLTKLDFTQAYYTDLKVLVVRVEDKAKYLDLEAVKERQGLRIGGAGAYAPAAKKLFPLADVATLPEIMEVFTDNVDAVLWDSVGARAWCLENPKYVFIDYGGALGQFFLAYSVPKGSFEWLTFLNSWLNLKRESQFTAVQENYWLSGVRPQAAAPQWSIMRNVLHWVD
jgi:ABC-type amino acid transport substrate-binding protein